MPVQTKDKFIAFVDILGFSELLRAEEASGRDLSRPLELAKLLGSPDKQFYPSVCPESRRMAADIDFKMTQISDCVVVSTEVSPVGAVNLAHYCFGIAIKFVAKGALCRGFVTRGKIYHDDKQFVGTGYLHAVENEKNVAFMRADVQERGTPFIQIDETVTEYVKTDGDNCVRMMFDRMTRSDGTYSAIYPFDALRTIPASVIWPGFDPVKWKGELQKSIGFRQRDLTAFEDSERSATDENVRRKIRHYRRGLEEVIAHLRSREGTLDRMISTGIIPYGGDW
ncbi:MAG: hypothetical protein WBB34_12455 [Xanthobacteraceae bacterium]